MSEEKRVLVCGGRDFTDADLINQVLNAVKPTLVIHGAYRGADTLADEWAKTNRVARLPFPADWRTYGPAAGPMRNQQMLDEGRPDLVLAFPGNDGTADMVRRAKTARVPTIRVRPGELPQLMAALGVYTADETPEA